MRPSKDLVAAIDKLVVRQGGVASEPGVAILVHQPGKLLFQKGYGLANLSPSTPITNRTLFELASCSKPFTATAVLLLHDRNKLSIDQDVRVLLPELPNYRQDNPILIRDLLSHTSGLPEYFDFEDVPKRNKLYSDNADYLPMFAKLKTDYPQEFKTGTKHSYCNSNYLLLALTVERASGKRYGEFVKEEIFAPLGMTHTFFYSSPQAVPTGSQTGYNRALGYGWNKKKAKWIPTWGTAPDYDQVEFIVGDGGIWTNLEDMYKWDVAVRARKFLKPETWRLAIAPATTRQGKSFAYGLGWALYYNKPDKINGFGHTGSWAGFITSYFCSNLTGRTTVLLSNREDFDGDAFWTELDNIIERH